MKFYHYTDNSNLVLENTNFSFGTTFKPEGLWLSYDKNHYGWKDWCLSENYRLDKLKYKYEVDINMNKILNIDSREKLIYLINNFQDCYLDYQINWNTLKEYYSGIAFIPYCRSWIYIDNNFNFQSTIWYSAIDCESICIWDLSTITHFGKAKPTNIKIEEE